MSTFNQWLASATKNPKPRQITFICGPEPVLVEDVLQHVKRQLEPAPWDYAHYVAGEDSERQIWNALDQYPLGVGYRLVVVRSAEQLQNWNRFIEWIGNRRLNPRTYVVLISNEEKIPRTEPTAEERKRGAKPELVPHLAAIGAKGHVIECRPYTTATAKHSLVWVRSKVPMREGVAKHLLERANFDLRLVRDTCVKLAAFSGEITMATINEMLAQEPRDTFSDALLAMDKKTAFLALQEVQPDEYGRIIGQLDSRLDLAGMVYDMQVEHRSPHEIARAAGAQAWLVPDIMKVTKHYNTKRRREIRRVLAMVDEAYQSGQRNGVLEVLAALW